MSSQVPPGSPRRAAWRPLSILAFTALALGGSANCAQERPAINRTQENGVRKALLVGHDYTDAADDPEFYMENFVVDAPVDQTLMPVGTYDNVDRVRWQIQENVLIARKSYEYVSGSNGRTSDGTTPDGQRAAGQRVDNGLIVAAYRIESHFDRRMAYNPATGEPLNVLEENTSDRVWHERDFVRVDWSQNLVDNPDWSFVFYGQLFGGLSFAPLRYEDNNPRSPQSHNFCELEPGMVRNDRGACVAAANPARHPGGYFDVTSKWLVRPETSDVFDEPIPTCLVANFFARGPVYSCSEQETTIRTSFRRVEDRDFEPLELTRQPYDLVGGPRADRNGFDQGYGINDRNFHRFAMVHNIWQRSHLSPVVQCTANDDANNDGTADQCAVAAAGSHPGSQCDTVMGKCTIPYRERALRPAAYYVNAEMPPEMQNHVLGRAADGTSTYRFATAQDPPSAITRGPSEDIIESWNLALMAAVANAREVECRRTGGARDACHNQFFENRTRAMGDGAWLAPEPKASNGPAVVLCHNPVVASDPQDTCREVGYRVRLGDIRYNHMSYWPGNSRAPFGGIAQWAYDPLTGEVVSNGGFNMGRSVEYAASQQRDYILMALGELSVSDYVDGAATARFSELLRNPASQSRGALPADELEARTHAYDAESAARAGAMRTPQAGSYQAGAAMHTAMLDDTSSPVAPSATNTAQRVEALSGLLRNTTIESDMVDPSWLANLGFDPNARRTQAMLDESSPLRRMDPEVAESRWQTLMGRLERRGFCFQDAGAPPMVGSEDLQGVARWFRRRYAAMTPDARARQIYLDLRQEAYKGIAVHEVGHSLGLYHLPVSSYDSMNYNPQYWQLRTHNGDPAATGTCTPTCSMNACDSVRNAGAQRNDDNCMGPRYLDAYTDEELGMTESDSPHAGINYFGNTSVMEYQWERFDETVGVGSYDHYAMGILYGRVLETMELDPARGGTPEDNQARFSARLRSQLGELDQINYRDPVLGESGVLPVHYTELARQLNVFDPSRCRAATDAEKARYRWRVVNGQLCQYAPRDHAAMVDFETSPTSDTSTTNAPSWRTRAETRTGAHALRWGYRVAWDIGTGYPHINYFDQGADLYEVTQSAVKKYDLSYPTMYFRRGAREFTGLNIPAYLARTLFRRVRGYHWNVARDVAYYGSVFSPALYEKLTRDDNWLRPYLVTGTLAFDFFASVMLRPEVGDYGPVPDPAPARRTLFDVPDPSDGDTMPVFTIGIIDGRYIGEEFDMNLGGSWDYGSYMRRAGSYPEKPLAAIMLTDTRPTFSSISRGLYLDGREFQVNFGTDMPLALNRLLGGILSEDWDTTAMHVPTDVAPPADGSLPQLTPQLLPLWTRPSTRNPTASPARPAGSRIVFPNIGYRQQLPTVIYSMLFSSLNSDLSTVHRTRIWVDGGPEQIDIPEEDRARFRNPESGITYVARRYGADLVDGVAIDRGIASRMLARANELVIDTYRVELDADLRPAFNPDGSVNPVFDARTHQPLPAHPDDSRRQAAAEIRFRNYVGLIDSTRYASRLLGYGLLR